MAEIKNKKNQKSFFLDWEFLSCGCLVLVVFFLLVLFGAAWGLKSGDKPPGQGGTNGILDSDCIEKLNSNAKQYVNIINQAAAKYGQDPALMMAQLQQESGFNPSAVSPAGAQGIAQFMPGTWASHGQDGNDNGKKDPFEAEDGIYAQAEYIQSIKNNLRRFGVEPSNQNVLASYNAGEGAVVKFGGIPPYPETQKYVKNIMLNYQKYLDCLKNNTQISSSESDCGEMGQKAVTFALRQVGRGYSQDAGQNIGGIDSQTFDCAGLYGSAWNYAGITEMYHSSVPTFSNRGELDYFPLTDVNQLKPGDAVFMGAFDNSADGTATYEGAVSPAHDYGHMGMYVGNVTVDGKTYQHGIVEARGTAYGVVIYEYNQRANNGEIWAKEFGRPKKCRDYNK